MNLIMQDTSAFLASRARCVMPVLHEHFARLAPTFRADSFFARSQIGLINPSFVKHNVFSFSAICASSAVK
jgi:hypothetical protein